MEYGSIKYLVRGKSYWVGEVWEKNHQINSLALPNIKRHTAGSLFPENIHSGPSKKSMVLKATEYKENQ